MTEKSIAAGGELPFERGMLWAIYFSGSTPIKRHALTRDEHLAWCKRQALEYVNAGDLARAVAGMGSDLRNHPDTDNPALPGLVIIGTMYAADGDKAAVLRWIERFQ